MNNLEPRAKIGDEVMVSLKSDVKDSAGWTHAVSMKSRVDGVEKKANGYEYLIEHPLNTRQTIAGFRDEHILKNLTTNISYE